MAINQDGHGCCPGLSSVRCGSVLGRLWRSPSFPWDPDTFCLHPRARSQACYWPTGTCNTGDSPTLVRGLHACLEPSPGGLWEGPLSTTYTPAPGSRYLCDLLMNWSQAVFPPRPCPGLICLLLPAGLGAHTLFWTSSHSCWMEKPQAVLS